MNVLEIYFQTEMTLSELADAIRASLGAACSQERFGLNRGGQYFQTEVFGLSMELLKNAGEVFISERADWPYYMLIYGTSMKIDLPTLNLLANHAALLLRARGLKVEVDSLT